MTRSWKQLASPAELAVAAFTVLYMIVWLIVALTVVNVEFVFYFVVMCLLIVAVALVQLRVRFTVATLWGLSIWGLVHMAGGLVPIPAAWVDSGIRQVLYNWWLVPGYLRYDHIVHAYGFGLVAWVCWQGLSKAFQNRSVAISPTLGLLTLCVAGGMGFGAANEVVEFIASLTLSDTNVGGYENTGWDLVANLVGCLIAASLIWFFTPTRENKSTPERRELAH